MRTPADLRSAEEDEPLSSADLTRVLENAAVERKCAALTARAGEIADLLVNTEACSTPGLLRALSAQDLRVVRQAT